jgi:hypothetical protein
VIGVLSACSAIVGIKNLTPGPSDEGDASTLSDADDGGAEALFDAAGDAAAACDADLSRDPNNCGSCAHGCAGGPCDAGRCTPVVVTSPEANLAEIRVVGDRVLYRADGHVKAVGLAGGLPSTLVVCANREGLDVNDAGFFSWCNTALTLRAVDDAGTAVGSSSIDGYGAAVGGDWLFFRRSTWELDRIPRTLSDGGFSGWGPVDTSTGGVRAWTATSSELFYMTTAGTLLHAALESGGGTELENNQSGPSEIAADDTAVFWATDSDTDQAILLARVFSAGKSSPIATGLDHPYGVAIDQTSVYLAMRGTPPAFADGAIARVPRDGGAVEKLAEGVLFPREIVVTDTLVVWTSMGTSVDGGYAGGGIYRLAK